MTSEKQGAAEWLRGIADKYQSEDGFGCREIVEMLGFCCDEIEMCNKCRVKAMKAIADRIDREMAEYEFLKKENAELKAELADWKGNAEGFQPDAYMKLPVDADGVPVCIGDKVNVDGDAMTVLGYRLYNGTLLLIVKKGDSNLTYTPNPSEIRHFKPVQPDSWEKLEEDVMKNSCTYFGQLEKDCSECQYGQWQSGFNCWQNKNLDIVKRAKRLAKREGR